MTEQAYSATRSAEASHFGMQALWRLAVWGMLATFALFAAVLTVYSNAGTQRTASVTSGQGNKHPRADIVEFKAEPSDPDEETRRLAEAVHALTADRDQLLTRVAALERNLDGVTGTIKRDRVAIAQPQGPQIPPPAPAQTPAQAQPQASPQIPAPAVTSRPEAPPGLIPPAAMSAAPLTPVTVTSVPMTTGSITPGPITPGSLAPAPTTPAPMTPASMPPASLAAAPVTEAALSPAKMPGSQQSGASDGVQIVAPDAGNRAASSPNPPSLAPVGEPTPSGLGVDVGGAANYEGLRTLWHATKTSDPGLMDDLYPMVTVRENSKTHGVELRLVIGPLADAEAASQLCTTLAEAHHYCQPVAFEGQRLSVSDAPSAKSGQTPTPPPAPAHHASSGHSTHWDSSSSAVKLTPFSGFPRGK